MTSLRRARIFHGFHGVLFPWVVFFLPELRHTAEKGTRIPGKREPFGITNRYNGQTRQANMKDDEDKLISRLQADLDELGFRFDRPNENGEFDGIFGRRMEAPIAFSGRFRKSNARAILSALLERKRCCLVQPLNPHLLTGLVLRGHQQSRQ